MKIDKIQCDICGKIVDYNNANIMNVPTCVRIDDEHLKMINDNRINKLKLNGLFKTVNYPIGVIHVDYDLCEECLLKLRDMILEMIDSNKVKLSDYRKGVKLNEIH